MSFSTGRSSTSRAFKFKRDIILAQRKALYGSGGILIFGDEKGDARKIHPQDEETTET
jgi:hypothetical protein